MYALGAFVGEGTDNSHFNRCAALFPGPCNMRTLALDGAGVFALANAGSASADLTITEFEGLSVVADARIDGRPDLAEALRLSSARARSAPAAELIARAWRRWGQDAPARLIGDYSFLLWDTDSRSLFLVRDYMGGRPLHYCCLGRGLIAASLPAALAAIQGDIEVDTFTLARYHALLPQTGPESFFRGVGRVEPGTVVRWHEGIVSKKRYWHPPRGELNISREAAAEEVAYILKQAVRDRAEGAWGVAAHLSAGMDSSAVAATLGECGIPATVITGEDLRKDPAPPGHIEGEADTAAATAALYPSLTHVLAHTEESPIISLMAEWNFAVDQPVRSIENAGWLDATYREAARAGASVLMTGAFGNNSFSHDGVAIFADLVRRGRFTRWFREARHHRAVSGARWRGVIAYSLGPAIPERFWRWYRGYPHWRAALSRLTLFRSGHPVLNELRTRALADHHDMAERPIRSPWHARAQELRWVDTSLFDFGARQRWGLTVTDPTTDRRLVEFTLQLPAHHWMENGRTRALARRVLEGKVAPEVIDPPGRGMQGAGWRAAAEACLPELRAEVQRQRSTQWGELLDLPKIDSMLERWPTSGWSDYNQLFLYRASLLRAISMGHYARVRSA